ncbi:hypothetical protein BA724_04315 [Domibacillus iocasae]|uniref:DUF2213 domain-containing protein n=2 Tax=Domibacillus iocasae TaxID=1714016 RepID=A0A1E7DQB1_9BACI|nr:hypothetical protein BA724_04315 [Domibacillus iocasae]
MLIRDSMLKKDSFGFLTVTAPITRPGVFPYQRQDGTVQYEAKLPDDVFSDLAIYSARAKPVTDGHPNEEVTVDNISRYSKGMTHTDSRVEGGMLVVSMTVTDAALMDRIFSGEQSEISIGFLSDIVEQRGTYQGDEYGYVQKNIDINHVAIVDRGRAGPKVAIRADSDAWQIDNESGGKPNMPVYKIDGKDYEVDPTVKAYMDAQDAKLLVADSKVKEYDSLKGRFDAQAVALEAAQKEAKDAKENQMSADELDQKVEARVALIAGAKPLLEDSFDFKGKSEREIKEAVILKAKPDFKGDGLSDDYVNAFYDATVGHVQQQGFSSTGSNHLFSGDGASSGQLQEKKNQRLKMNQ